MGTKLFISQYGAGATTLVQDTGVNIRTALGGGLVLAAQYSVVTLVKRATDEWYLY